MRLRGDVAWIREGTGVPNRLSGRIGVHTQVKETAAVMPTPKKAGGTNRSLLNPLLTSAEIWLRQIIKPQTPTLNFANFFFIFRGGGREETQWTVAPLPKSYGCPEWNRTEKRKECWWPLPYQLLPICYISTIVLSSSYRLPLELYDKGIAAAF